MLALGLDDVCDRYLLRDAGLAKRCATDAPPPAPIATSQVAVPSRFAPKALAACIG